MTPHSFIIYFNNEYLLPLFNIKLLVMCLISYYFSN